MKTCQIGIKMCKTHKTTFNQYLMLIGVINKKPRLRQIMTVFMKCEIHDRSAVVCHTKGLKEVKRTHSEKNMTHLNKD